MSLPAQAIKQSASSVMPSGEMDLNDVILASGHEKLPDINQMAYLKMIKGMATGDTKTTLDNYSNKQAELFATAVELLEGDANLRMQIGDSPQAVINLASYLKRKKATDVMDARLKSSTAYNKLLAKGRGEFDVEDPLGAAAAAQDDG